MDQVNFFKCLSDETRLNIVTLIAENKELCVCDLTEKLQLSQPKISRHLALLRSSGLLQDRRQSHGCTTALINNFQHGVLKFYIL